MQDSTSIAWRDLGHAAAHLQAANNIEQKAEE
jgi:hypothetical protein